MPLRSFSLMLPFPSCPGTTAGSAATPTPLSTITATRTRPSGSWTSSGARSTRRGYDVTGIDLSKQSIADARTRAAAEGLDVTFAQGDMRTPYCEGCADGVVNLFTTFGYFEDDAENQRALRAMATALRPGGWFLQDFLNAPQVRATLTPTTTRTENGVTIHQERWIADGRINKTITLEQNDTTETFRESVRLFTLDDFRAMYEAVGLTLVATYGDYDGASYTETSPRLLLHARRPST